MQRLRRTSLLTTGVVSLALIAAACGSSGGGSSTATTAGGTSATTAGGTSATTAAGGGSTSLPNQHYADNNTPFSPVTGGTLTMLGTGDVDYMDPNVAYYTVGYLSLRMWSRQLYTYPATTGKTVSVVPDLATAAPNISADGKTYKVTIRTGAMWNTSPPRQVTAADVVLGVKRQCNPTQPFGGQPDFSAIIAGYSDFCTAFSKVSGTDAAAQKAFMDSNQISGVSVDPSDPQTVVFTLTHAASFFSDILAMPAFSPAPVEFEQYLPASNDLAQHTISDGPYMIKSYDPAKTIVFVRNPAWQQSSDTVRHAYVNEIDVNETGSQTTIHQEILTNSSAADMVWDTSVPSAAIPGLLASKDPRLSLQSEYASNPYIIFNTQSPNNGGALGNVAVRQALEYAFNRSNLIQNSGGPQVTPPLTHILPPGIGGSSPDYDLYANDPAKAKSLLASAGQSNLTLKFLYRSAEEGSAKDFQTVQSDLSAIGVKVVGVPVPNADFYTKYLEVPTTAKSGVWDLSLAGWSPDWYGDAASSFFGPLFDGRVLPPTSSNFGLFNDPAVNALIDQANSAASASAAAALWHQADMLTMKDAAIFPIADPNRAQIHGSQVHNCIYVAEIDNCDPTNVWLKS